MKGYEQITTDAMPTMTCGEATLIGKAYDKFKAKNPKFVEWLKRGKRIGLACGENVYRRKLGGRNLRKFFIVLLTLSLSACGAVEVPSQAGPSSSPGPVLSFDLKAAKWGVFMHYLEPHGSTTESWNEMVNGFDVEGLADQLEEVGASYFFITVGQYLGFYMAPNQTYDSIVGAGRTAKRDLVADLGKALRARDIALFVYLPYGAPYEDEPAIEALEWRSDLNAFQENWNAVIAEWSLRWGCLVSGWWFDDLWRPENDGISQAGMAAFISAARAGNPASLVALNDGDACEAEILSIEDFSAGENKNPACSTRVPDFPEDKTYHVLSFLGEYWMSPSIPRFTDQEVVEISSKIIAEGGVITWDVPHDDHGLILPAYVAQLKALSEAIE